MTSALILDKQAKITVGSLSSVDTSAEVTAHIFNTWDFIFLKFIAISFSETELAMNFVTQTDIECKTHTHTHLGTHTPHARTHTV